MNEKPRPADESILTGEFLARIGAGGVSICVMTTVAFLIGYHGWFTAADLGGSALLGSTMAFGTLCVSRLFHGFNCRSRHSIFKIGLASNIYSVGAFFGGVLLLALVIFVPVMRTLFSVSPLSGYQIGMIALLAFIPTVIIQLYKVMKEHVHA